MTTEPTGRVRVTSVRLPKAADTLAAHSAILQAIAAHDPDGAYPATLAHLDHSQARLRGHNPELAARGMYDARGADPLPAARHECPHS